MPTGGGPPRRGWARSAAPVRTNRALMRPSSPTRTFPSRRCPTWRRPTRPGVRSSPPPSACGPRGGGAGAPLLLLLLPPPPPPPPLLLLLFLVLFRRLALRLRTWPLILPPNRPSLPRTPL